MNGIRIRIVELLLRDPLGVSEIAEMLGASKNVVSKHLRILREAELLFVTKRGQHRSYAVPESIKKKCDPKGHIIELGCCSFQFAQRRSQQ